METMFFENQLVIVTENVDGKIYAIKANSIEELLNDWNNNCDFVPENDARVFFIIYNGEPINPYSYSNFESAINYLEWLMRKNTWKTGEINNG